MSKQTDQKRRNFLARVGLGSVGAAAAAVGGLELAGRQSQGGGAGEKWRRGYQLTEHVRNYYRTTRV